MSLLQYIYIHNMYVSIDRSCHYLSLQSSPTGSVCLASNISFPYDPSLTHWIQHFRLDTISFYEYYGTIYGNPINSLLKLLFLLVSFLLVLANMQQNNDHRSIISMCRDNKRVACPQQGQKGKSTSLVGCNTILCRHIQVRCK